MSLVAMVAALLIVNAILTSKETKRARADSGKIIDLPGGDLQVREDGPPGAPPIVLIHGWAASLHWWDRVVPLLARQNHVVQVDLLGHGGSEKPNSGYSMQHQATQVALALGRLGVKSALVAGHSTGGEVAIALAAAHPNLVSRLVVLDTEPAESYVDVDFLTRASLAPVIGQALRRVITDGQIRDGLEQAFTKGFRVPAQFVRDFHRLTWSSYKQTFDKSSDYVKDGDLARDYRSVAAPTMVVFGAKDRLVEPQAAQQFGRMRRTRIVLVPDSGHSPMVQKPAQVARLIGGFTRPASGRPGTPGR